MRFQRLVSLRAIIVLLLVTTISFSCTSNTIENSDKSAIEDPTSKIFGGARFVVEAPFSSAVLEIEPNGSAIYEASSPDTGIDRQTKSKKLDGDDISNLVEAVLDANFLSLDESYPYKEGISYEDGSTYIIEVTIGGETKKVTSYQSECPDGFNQVMDAIREVWEEEILEVGV